MSNKQKNMIVVIDDNKSEFEDAKDLLENGNLFKVIPETNKKIKDSLDRTRNSETLWEYLPKLLREYEEQICLIVCDLKLNNTDLGLDIISRIRTDRRFKLSNPLVNRFVPIIAYSRYPDKQSEALNNGATTCIQKINDKDDDNQKKRKRTLFFRTAKALAKYYVDVLENITEILWPDGLSNDIRNIHESPQIHAFLMTSFAQKFDKLIDDVKKAFETHGIEVHIAKDPGGRFNDSIFRNIQVFMHGCNFGIALYTDDSNKQEYEKIRINPNLSLEVGYMLALAKPVCILKDKKLEKMNVDLIDRLYCEFDADNPESLNSAIESWLKNRGFLKGSSSISKQ